MLLCAVGRMELYESSLAGQERYEGAVARRNRRRQGIAKCAPVNKDAAPETDK